MILRGLTLILNKVERSYLSYISSIPGTAYKWVTGDKSKEPVKYSDEVKAELILNDSTPIIVMFKDISSILNTKVIKLDKKYVIYQAITCTYIDPEIKFITINVLGRQFFLSLKEDRYEDHVTDLLFGKGAQSSYNLLYDNIMNETKIDSTAKLNMDTYSIYNCYYKTDDEAITLHTYGISNTKS